MSIRISLVALPLLLTLAGAAGCTISENRYPLPVSPADAPKTFAPLAQCGKQLGYSVNTYPDRVDIVTDSFVSVVYVVEEGLYRMDVVLTGDRPADQREATIKANKAKGDQIWACAQDLMKNQTTPAPTSPSVPAASSSAPSTASSAAPPVSGAP